MNISEQFAEYLETLGVATRGTDLWIGRAPTSVEVPDDIWWIIQNGGSPVRRNSTGETLKSYQVQIYGRSRNYKKLLDDLFVIEQDLNCDGCSQLSGLDTIDIEAVVFPIDNDLDSEDRKVGLLQANITTYKEC